MCSMMSEDNSCAATTGSKLRNLRIREGKTLEEVAKGVGVSATAIHYFETGIRYPKADIQLALADYFRVAWCDVFCPET